MSDLRSERSWTWFVRGALAVLVGLIFVYAGAVKVWDPLTFATDISNYQILPWPISIRIAFYLPWLEVLCGLGLIFHRLFAGALFLTGGLMLVFVAATISARARGINVDCGCFGSVSGNLSFSWHLLLDFGLLGILVLLWFWPRPAPATT